MARAWQVHGKSNAGKARGAIGRMVRDGEAMDSRGGGGNMGDCERRWAEYPDCDGGKSEMRCIDDEIRVIMRDREMRIVASPNPNSTPHPKANGRGGALERGSCGAMGRWRDGAVGLAKEA
jgi:hypothetical protein